MANKKDLVAVGCDPNGCACLRCGGVTGQCNLACESTRCVNRAKRPCTPMSKDEYKLRQYQGGQKQ